MDSPLSTPELQEPSAGEFHAARWLESVGLERRAESGESSGLVGVGGVLTDLFGLPTTAAETRIRRNGMGSHQSAAMENGEWLTPPDLKRPLGEFDLDPCAPIVRPWPTAKAHYTVEDDGLSQPWFGRVWLNPPYGSEADPWMERLVTHGIGTALLFARTETELWFRWIWPHASGLLFIRGRLFFRYVTGQPAESNGGAPSVLIAYGSEDARILQTCGIPGFFVGGGGAELVTKDSDGTAEKLSNS